MSIQRPSSLVDMAVDQLIKLIEERGLRQDDTLPPTAELAQSMDVSRTVVREAIAELAGQGLLVRRQGRETVVALPDAAQLERLLRFRFAVNGADFRGLQEYREVLEVGAASLAAQRAKELDITDLSQRLDELAAADQEETLHLRDQAFHRAIARISGNDMVLLTLDGIAPLLFDLRRHALSGWIKAGGSRGQIMSAHELIFDRIRARDASGAAAAMTDHLAQARAGLDADRD